MNIIPIKTRKHQKLVRARKKQTKKEFIGEYLNKKLKNHNLPYGLKYYTLVYETEEEAEKLWKALKSKN